MSIFVIIQEQSDQSFLIFEQILSRLNCVQKLHRHQTLCKRYRVNEPDTLIDYRVYSFFQYTKTYLEKNKSLFLKFDCT